MIKIIWILWMQKFDNAPELVKRCLESWIHYNPSWKIIELDMMNLNQFIDYPFNGKMSHNHYSDIVRIL